ncbi:hypothetical protein CI109_102513 [Kwoniella shandongensis]|uniref:Protein kinase regulator n=1 Tax=Kwoniella shandongensis TaxID=1734106 RepID=A0AAJ8LIU6_9TREE
MAVTSPTSASPSMSLLEWDEAAVHSYLSHIGLNQYEDVIYEHGITGDVLSVMDHVSLQDLGMTSLGHRLTLLRAVWELKKEQGIEIAEDDWRPQDVVEEEKVHPGDVDRLLDLINDQHERLIHIERDHSRLLSALEENGIVVPSPNSAEVRGIPGMENSRGGLSRGGSLRWRDFKERVEEGDEAESSTSTATKAARRGSTIFPSSLASSTNSNPPVPLTSDSATFQDSFTPTTTTASYPFDSPLGHVNGDRDRNQNVQGTKLQKPPFTRLISDPGTNTSSAPTYTPPAGSTAITQSLSASAASRPSTSSGPLVSASAPNPNPPSSSSATAGPSDREKSRAKDAAHSAAKSFRVTLDDPCWKVLPAALKKYKINDDWKLYALFICFDNTERCLSYDEKPLLLFQKLKETGHRPVFMLRHIKDIRSPIAVAQQKQAQKLGLPATSTVNLLPKIKPTSDTSISPTKATLQPGSGRRDDGHGQTPNGGTFPELPSPGLREGDANGSGSAGGSRSASGPGAGMSTVLDADGNVQNVTYAVAIYPYIADREDEFNVAVGSTYIILSKAKGWYVVQKDPDGLGSMVDSSSGWVPAGCLLELSQPISVVSPSPNGQIAPYPGLSPLPPSAIMSSSYAGHVLMDYEAKGDDELTLKEGEQVRVYKKYCHWIKSDTGERGWVPAWFVGKTGALSSTTSTSNPISAGAGAGGETTTNGGQSSATTPTAYTSAQGQGLGHGIGGEGEERTRDEMIGERV